MIRLKDGFRGERALMLPKMITDLMDKDPLTSVLYITYIGYYPRARYHFRRRSVPIDQYILIYCVDGSGWYAVGGNEFTVKANQYFILPAGVPHVYGADEEMPWTIYWIHFKGNLASGYTQGGVCPRDVGLAPHSRIGDRIALFEEMFSVLNMGYSLSNLRYSSSLFHHFLGSLCYKQQFRMSGREQAGDGNMVEAIVHYMKENVEKFITLRDISDYAGLSKSYLSALFKKETGYTLLSYFNLLKVRQACVMLDTTDLKINQICYKVGIEDCFYFSRLFKKIMGMLPNEYRRLQREIEGRKQKPRPVGGKGLRNGA